MLASAGALLQPRGLGWGRAVSPLDWVFTPNSCVSNTWSEFWRETADGGRRERRRRRRPGRDPCMRPWSSERGQ